MTPRAKSALILLATFVLGLALGFLLHAQMVDERMERMATLRSPKGFTQMYLRAIEPRDAAQELEIRVHLEEAAERIRAVGENRRREIREIIEDTKARLEPILTEEQLNRLEQKMEHHRLRHAKKRGARPRPEAARSEAPDPK